MKKITYSVTFTEYDTEAQANRQKSTWVSGANKQALTAQGITRILRRTYKNASLVKFEQWADAR